MKVAAERTEHEEIAAAATQLQYKHNVVLCECSAILCHFYLRMALFLYFIYDYCNGVLAESPKAITDKLQRVLNAAARVVTETRKYDRGLTDILHNELHWLSVTQRVN